MSRPTKNNRAPAQTGGCTHIWLVAPPEGRLSIGRCSECGEERQFANSEADATKADRRGFNDLGWQR